MAGQYRTGQEGRVAGPGWTEPATHSVLQQLRETIVAGKITPGTRLRAESLATLLNVSRTPVRSALAVLSAEGLVSYSVNRGYTVHAVTAQDVLNSIEVRASLEGIAARTVAAHGWEPGALETLADLVVQSRAVLDRGTWTEQTEHEWYQLNWVFHRSIMLASKNRVLRNATRMTLIYPVLGDAVRLCPSIAACVSPRLRRLPPAPPSHVLESQAKHEALMNAFRREDGEEAQHLMTEHVLATKHRLHAAIMPR